MTQQKPQHTSSPQLIWHSQNTVHFITSILLPLFSSWITLCTYTHMCTHIHTHAHFHIYTQTQIHTHTHTGYVPFLLDINTNTHPYTHV